jgi:prophage regulatory protein
MNTIARFLRLPQVKELTCLSKSSIYRLMAEGDFPKQVALGPRSVVWVKSQIDDWCESKLNGTQFNQYYE